MAMTLAQLQSQLSGLNEYTPESEDALRARAQAVYDPQYNQDLAALRDSLQQQVNATERGAIRTGMQRSSYNNASLVGLVGAGQKAQAQLAAQREGNIASLLLQLIQSEKDRKAQADQQRNSLLLNLYQLGNQNSGGYYYNPGKNDLTPTDDSKDKNGPDKNNPGKTPTISDNSPLLKVPSITALADQYVKKVQSNIGKGINNSVTNILSNYK